MQKCIKDGDQDKSSYSQYLSLLIQLFCNCVENKKKNQEYVVKKRALTLFIVVLDKWTPEVTNNACKFLELVASKNDYRLMI